MQKKPLTKSKPFHDKSAEESENRRMFCSTIRTTYDKHRSNIILNGEQLKPFPLKSGMRQGYLLSQLILKIVLKFLTRTIRQEQQNKGIQKGKEIKLSCLWMT
jgi:hypothetical protein